MNAYVIAHEYAHHVQNLLGTNQQVTPGEAGPTSGTVRLELQADCYAGAWANHAETVPDESGAPLIAEINADDIDRALDAAGRIGDDFIQRELGGGTGQPGRVHARLARSSGSSGSHRLRDRRPGAVRHLRAPTTSADTEALIGLATERDLSFAAESRRVRGG